MMLSLTKTGTDTSFNLWSLICLSIMNWEIALCKVAIPPSKTEKRLPDILAADLKSIPSSLRVLGVLSF